MAIQCWSWIYKLNTKSKSITPVYMLMMTFDYVFAPRSSRQKIVYSRVPYICNIIIKSTYPSGTDDTAKHLFWSFNSMARSIRRSLFIVNVERSLSSSRWRFNLPPPPPLMSLSRFPCNHPFKLTLSTWRKEREDHKFMWVHSHPILVTWIYLSNIVTGRVYSSTTITLNIIHSPQCQYHDDDDRHH